MWRLLHAARDTPPTPKQPLAQPLTQPFYVTAQVAAAEKLLRAAEIRDMMAQQALAGAGIDADRAESAKAGAIAAAGGALGALPFVLASGQAGAPALLSLGASVAACLLFGVTYRWGCLGWWAAVSMLCGWGWGMRGGEQGADCSWAVKAGRTCCRGRRSGRAALCAGTRAAVHAAVAVAQCACCSLPIAESGIQLQLDW